MRLDLLNKQLADLYLDKDTTASQHAVSTPLPTMELHPIADSKLLSTASGQWEDSLPQADQKYDDVTDGTPDRFDLGAGAQEHAILTSDTAEAAATAAAASGIAASCVTDVKADQQTQPVQYQQSGDSLMACSDSAEVSRLQQRLADTAWRLDKLNAELEQLSMLEHQLMQSELQPAWFSADMDTKHHDTLQDAEPQPDKVASHDGPDLQAQQKQRRQLAVSVVNQVWEECLSLQASPVSIFGTLLALTTHLRYVLW